jgi:hypothetical protein
MTDRVQPGGIDSIVRNDELSQVLGQFSDGYIVPSTQPTPASERRSEIDETVLDAFNDTSLSGLDITIAPGEAFVGGWCARDVDTTLSLPANTQNMTVVLAWNPDSIFDPVNDGDRDDADEIIIGREVNVNSNFPQTPLFELSTNDTAFQAFEDLRQIGPALSVNRVDIENELALPRYQTQSDVPNDLDEGALVYIRDTDSLFTVDN